MERNSDPVNSGALNSFLDGLGSRMHEGETWTLAVYTTDGRLLHGGEEVTEEELKRRKERHREKHGALPTPSGLDFRGPSERDK